MLEEAGVATVAGTSFGIHGEGYIRFSYGELGREYPRGHGARRQVVAEVRFGVRSTGHGQTAQAPPCSRARRKLRAPAKHLAALDAWAESFQGQYPEASTRPVVHWHLPADERLVSPPWAGLRIKRMR